MEEKIKLLIKTLGEERVKLEEPLSHHTFSKVGGPAQVFYIATSQDELSRIFDLSTELKIPCFIFGNGTKIIISNQGIKGLVVKNRTSKIRVSGIKGKVGKGSVGVDEATIEVDSGVSIGRLNEFLSNQGLAEIANASSLHASLGGAIFLDPNLIQLTQKLKVWDKQGVSEIDPMGLKRNEHIVLSAILKIKAII